MTDTLKDAATQVILTALHAAEQTGAWLKGQMPDVLQQLIHWAIAEDIFTMALLVIVAGLYALLIRKYIPVHRAAKAAYKGCCFDISDVPCGFVYLAAFIAGGVALLVLAISSVICAYDLVEVLIAPKVWILEYARALIH